MSPRPEDPAPCGADPAPCGADPAGAGAEHPEDIVVSGVAAMMPGCTDMPDFIDKLYNKVNLADNTDARWNISHPELPPHSGKVPGLDRFDSQFFMVNTRLAQFTDVMSKKLLELSYEALFDAGVAAGEMNGKRVAVFVACSYCESEKFCSYQEGNQGIAGCNRAMFANRISYWLNSNGPSTTLDCYGCGSIVALEQAYHAMRSGGCEAALIGAGRVLLHPQSVIHYGRQVPLNQTGFTKSYDKNADGESLSECIGVIFLQKRKNARRIYATVAHIKTGYNAVQCRDQQFAPILQPESFEVFLNEFYKEAGVPPSVVEYVEGYGSALPKSDKAELDVIDKVFTKDRKKPLLVGTVMSNVGNTEAVSGLSSLIKLLLAYQKGQIASNINYETPRDDVAGIREGRLKIVTDAPKFDRSYTALNSFSIIGAHGHMLLKGSYVKNDFSKYKSDIPYLLAVSGRHESAVMKILNWVKSRPLNAEEIVLLNQMHKVRNYKHLTRGFGVFKPVENETQVVYQEVDFCDTTKRTLWFVYSGMGSQWVGMGKQLMRIPIFANAIKRCDQVLSPKGVDIVKILTEPDKTTFDNILHSFIGIAAVQIGITDVVKAVGIVPDYIIGHSVGELGCAYADGCVTAEEMILLAYYRGLVSIQTTLIRGSMAAIGMGYKQISKILPPEIEVACRNGPDSSTISGPAEIMKKFVDELSSQGIFAKEVACSNIAYHSRYIATAGPKLLEYCRKVLKTPKLRSDRWLSTSIPGERWNEPASKYSSAEYHVNNLLNPVLFEETCQNIPHDAVLIEIAPHGLLQAILKRSLSPDCDYIPLTRRNHIDNAEFLLEAIGKIYMKGYEVDVSALNPKVEYPVSTETPPLSQLVEWDHSEKWGVCCYLKSPRITTACYKPIVTVYDEEYQYLDGYRIQGKRTFPYTAALIHVWETLAMSLDRNKDEMPVEFQNIHFFGQPALLDQNSLHLKIEINKGNGRFEVTSKQGIIVDGYIKHLVDEYPIYELENEAESLDVASDDVYIILEEKGFEFINEFKVIKKVNKSLTRAELIWSNNWVTLIEGMIQQKILSEEHYGISKLDHIRGLSINPKLHLNSIQIHDESKVIVSRFYKLRNAIGCGGVFIENISFKNMLKKKLQTPILKSYNFMPYFQTEYSDEIASLYFLMQIVAENVGKDVITVLNYGNIELPGELYDLLKSPPQINIEIIKFEESVMKTKTLEKPDLVIVDKNQSEKKIFEMFYTFLPSHTFLITTGVNIEGTYPLSLYKPVASRGLGINKLELAIWKPTLPTASSAITVKTSSDFELLRYSHVDLPPSHKLLIFTSYPPIPGFKDLVKELRGGSGCRNVYAALIDRNTPKDDVEHTTAFDLAFNVLTRGTWGGEYYTPNAGTNLTSGHFVSLQCLQPGDLDSMAWVKAPQQDGTGIFVTVHFAGLNVYDARRAIAEIPSSENEGYGMDYSGVTERGTRVMGLLANGAASTVVKADPQLLWPVPQHWSLEDAATIPLAYCLAFYCLGHTVILYRGQSVLVHGGAGALGQAVISIALAHGCNVFTTVSDLYKKRLLKRLFPDLPADHIGNSRDETFSDMVLHQTKGEGCEIVISCVKGELKNRTLNCCAAYGTTIDTVQIHTREDFNYGMFFMTKARSYVPIDFISIFKNQDQELLKKLHTMVSDGIRLGYVRPLIRVTYEANEVKRGLTLLASSKHRGRVLIKVRTLGINAVVPRLHCSPDKYQLIFCDQDDFGLQLADKLVKNGAKRLLLHQARASAFLDYKMRVWKGNSVQVQLLSTKISDKKSAHSFLRESSQFGLVEGISIVAANSNERSHILVAEIDAASRELLKFLSYFAIMSRDHCVGYDVHLQRTHSGLPSIFTQLHNLQMLGDFEARNEKKPQLNRDTALDGIEMALCKENAAWLVSGENIPANSILDEIFKASGLDSLSDVDGKSTLEDLGVDEGRAILLQKLIDIKFGVYLPSEQIPKMKIAEFKKLQVDEKDLTVDEGGLSACFNFIDTDEIRATCDLIPLPSLAHTEKLRPEEFDMKKMYMSIVPGIEGSYKRFRGLSERLKLPVAILQLAPLTANCDLVAQTLREVMRKKMIVNQQFYLLGYEFGAMVVLRLAAILEQTGMTGTVYCLGGSPEDIRNYLSEKLQYNDEDELENALIHHVYNILTENLDGTNYLKPADIEDFEEEATDQKERKVKNNKELTEKLKDIDNWKDKIEACIQLLKINTTHTHQYARDILQTIYARIHEIKNSKINPVPLKSKVVFIRPIGAKSTEDLTLYSKDYVVHNLNCTLGNMTKDLEVSMLVNKYLSPEILEDYENKNHCETVVRKEALFATYKHSE